MRAPPPLGLTLGILGLTLFAGGCRAQEPAKTGGNYDTYTGDGDGGPGNQGGGTRATGLPSGPPVVNFPGFEVLNDGRSVVSVQVRGPFQIAEQKAEGRIVYALGGVAVPERVNRLPLVTQHFPTQVTAVTVVQTPGGANLIIDLRESSGSTFKVEANEAGNLLTIVLPRSVRFGQTDPALDPNNFERPVGSTDVVDQSASDGAPEDYERETARRQKKSKRQPRPYVERPLTLPRMTIAPDIAISLADRDVGEPLVFLTSGIHWGIIDQLEIELTPHSFRIAPDGAWAFPSFGITAGYTGHTFEIGGRARYFVGIDTREDTSAGALLLGAPMAIHLSKWGKIETGVFATLDFESSLSRGSDFGESSNGQFRAGLYNQHASAYYIDSGVPFHFLFQPIKEMWFGIHHGLAIYDFDNVGDTLALPLGAEVGISASNDFNPTADLLFRFDMPLLFVPGREDPVEEDAYQLAVWFRWFYHL